MKPMQIVSFGIGISLFAFPVESQADIEKTAQICETGICFQWWPKLPQITGWHPDEGSSKQYSFNAQAPDGFTFSNAETVIYASAHYKPRMPDIKSLEMFIDSDKKNFKELQVQDAGALFTGDGKRFKSLKFFPKKEGNFEQVTYGEEGDFYLIFALSSRTKAGFEKALPAYLQFINKYKEKMK